MRIGEFLNKRFPTILGLFFLLVSLGGAIYLTGREQLFGLRAGPLAVPRKVRFSNITENGFTVSWITDEMTTGFLNYGETLDFGFTATDERDQLTGESGAYLTHYCSVRGLKPETTYYLKVGSGKSLFDNNGAPYQVKTAPVIGDLAVADPVSGRVYSADNTPFEGAVVYLTVSGSSLLSSRSLKNGSFTISLSSARTENLLAYQSYDQETAVVSIEVEAAQSMATALVNTANDNPAPPIILGKNHDFREKTAEEKGEGSPTTHFSLEGEGPTASPSGLVLLNPLNEDEELNTQRPEFKGTAPPEVVISIQVESETIYTGSVTVDEEGNWQWSPPADLEPGTHTVTLSFVDKQGEEQTMSRSFVVLAAGQSELPSFEATPSAEATPSPTPSPSPQPRVSMPSTEEGVPEPGVLTPTFYLFIMGLGLLIGGSVLKFFHF